MAATGRSCAPRLQRRHNADYWVAKIGRNRERDRLYTDRLTGDGWLVLRVWETDIIRNPGAAAEVVRQAVAGRLVQRGSMAAKDRPPEPRRREASAGGWSNRRGNRTSVTSGGSLAGMQGIVRGVEEPERLRRELPVEPVLVRGPPFGAQRECGHRVQMHEELVIGDPAPDLLDQVVHAFPARRSAPSAPRR